MVETDNNRNSGSKRVNKILGVESLALTEVVQTSSFTSIGTTERQNGCLAIYNFHIW